MCNQDLVALSQDQGLNFDGGDKVMIIDPRYDLDWLTNDEAGMCWIEDEDMAHQILGKAIKEEYQALYEDESPNTYEDLDLEKDLNRLINIQEHMAKGMSLIKEMTHRRDKALNSYLLNKYRFSIWMDRLERGEDKWNSLSGEEKKAKSQIYRRWKENIWSKANPIRAERDASYKAYEGHKEYLETPRMSDYLNRLWERWFELKDQSQALVGESMAGASKIWREYFQLIEDEDYLLFTGFDPEEIDNQEWLFSDTAHIEGLRESHLRDPFSAPPADKDKNDIPHIPIRTGGYVPRCKDVTHQYRPANQIAKEWAELDNQMFAAIENGQVFDEPRYACPQNLLP
jgi:hypothetical protein